VAAAGRQAAVARRNLEKCTVRAPFAGVVVSREAEVGEIVSPVSAGPGGARSGIATIVDMTSLEAEVDIGESVIGRVQQGQRVRVTLDAFPDWRIHGRVRTTIPAADRQKATVKVLIAFDKLDPRILPNMGVQVGFLGPTGEGNDREGAVERAKR
jgi:multidrug resistance efflux pump